MGTAKAKAFTTFNNVKSIIFIVGGFGLVLLAFGAIFGKIKWSAFASLAVGLAILAAAGAIVRYATGDTNLSATGTGSGGFGDTFRNLLQILTNLSLCSLLKRRVLCWQNYKYLAAGFVTHPFCFVCRKACKAWPET